MRRPSLGLLDWPWPTLSGRMMKYFSASSGWPLPNRRPPYPPPRNPAPVPPVPCRISTPLRTTPSASLRGVPDGAVVNLHLGHALAAREREVARDEIAFDRRRETTRAARSGRHAKKGRDGESEDLRVMRAMLTPRS